MALFVFQYILYNIGCGSLLSLYKTSGSSALLRPDRPVSLFLLVTQVAFVIVMYSIYTAIIVGLVFWLRHATIAGAHFGFGTQFTLDLVGGLIVFSWTRYYAFFKDRNLTDRLVALFDFLFVTVVTRLLFLKLR